MREFVPLLPGSRLKDEYLSIIRVPDRNNVTTLIVDGRADSLRSLMHIAIEFPQFVHTCDDQDFWHILAAGCELFDELIAIEWDLQRLQRFLSSLGMQETLGIVYVNFGAGGDVQVLPFNQDVANVATPAFLQYRVGL